MNLHTNKKLFSQAIKATSQKMQMNELYIEKDYWITLALHIIYSNPIGDSVVFKGGTSLSKCFGLIDRFSEDIDLIIERFEGETDSRLKNKTASISKIVDEVMPEVEILGITTKKGMNRKTAHSYPQIFEGAFGQIRDKIIIEASWLGYHAPNLRRSIISYIGKMMIETKQDSIAEEYHLLAFEIKVLEPNKTMCEKIMSLVRFSYSKDAISDLKSKIRHIYDLHQLLLDTSISSFFESSEFETMLIEVAKNDLKSYKHDNDWLLIHPKEAIIFKNHDKIWVELSQIYNNDFKKLVYGRLPNDSEILSSLKKIKNRIEKINWNLN